MAERPRPGKTTTETAVRTRLIEILDAAGQKDLSRLDSYHLYGPHFSKFTTAHANRLDAAETQKEEHNGVGALRNLKMEAEGLKIDVFGTCALATFIMHTTGQAGESLIDKRFLSTMVFVFEKGSWKIAHEHFSQPPPSK